MNGPVATRFAALLEGWTPGSLLLVGEPPAGAHFPPAEVTRIGAPGALQALEVLGRFDVAAVAFGRAAPPGDEVELLLGRLKNLHAPRIVAWIDAGEALAGRLRALAFEPDSEAPALWIHDIDRYNPRREWNSPDDWAHPENFDKYRW